jgi:hypothetical protein
LSKVRTGAAWILLIWAGFQWWHPLMGARVVLAFVAPQMSPSESERAGWGAPGELALALLNDPGWTTGISRALEQQPDPDSQAALREAFALTEEKRLNCQLLGPTLVQIEVLDREPKRARIYCTAVVTYLKAALQEERLSQEVNSQLDSDLVQSRESLADQESRLTSGITQKARPGPVAMQYLIHHYQDALEARSQALQNHQQWTDRLQACAPEFVVISGPENFRSTAWPWIGGAAALALLLGLVPSGARPPRGHQARAQRP